MGLTFRFAALFAVLFTAALPARADWTGTLRTSVEPPMMDPRTNTPAPAQNGIVSGKGTKMRLEMEQPAIGKVVAITDMKAHTSMMISDAQKAFLTIDLNKVPAHSTLASLRCDGSSAVACLTKAGFTKTGAEVENGKKSDRWERDDTTPQGEKKHETLWIPQGVKGFALVKQETKTPRQTITVDVLDFKETSLPDSLFEPPAGYADMTGKANPSSLLGHGAGGPPAAHTHP